MSSSNDSDQPAVSSDIQRPSNVRWLIFALSCGASWFLYLHRYTWNFIGPDLEKEFGFNKTETQALFSFFTPTYGGGQIPSGLLSDWIGPHMFLGIIIVLWSVTVSCFGLGRGFTSFAALRLVFGATQAGAYPNLNKVTASWFPASSRTIVQGWIATFFGRGGGAMSSIILGTVLMGWLHMSWRGGLVVMGIMGIVFGVVFLVLFRNSPDIDTRVNQAERDLIHAGSDPIQEDAPRVLPWRRVIRNRTMLFFVIQQIFSAGADTIYVSLMGDYFLNAKGFEVVKAGIFVSMPLWGGAIGGMLGGFCNDWMIRLTGSRRWGRCSVGFTGKFIACILMFVVIAQETGFGAAWALFFVKFFTDWSQPTVWGTCTDLGGGKYSATVFGILNTSGSIGGIITPILFGLILDTWNYNVLFTTVAIMYMISAVCWFMIDGTTSLERDFEPGTDSHPVPL